ncbi:penicillin-binding protein activator [Bacterioplanoides sp.]|uniref:penicillin-binding protein activator n=1 Tax=Bacterioplanoides sp. TaxID=2066072 RepID=UPI003AFFDFA9
MLKTGGLLLLAGCFGFGLSGCSTTPKQPELQATEQNTVIPAEQQQLAQAANSIKNGEFRNAALQLQLLAERSLSYSDQVEYWLLQAELNLATADIDNAEQALQQVQNIQQFATPEQERHYSLLRAQLLEAQHQYLAAARERDFLAGILSDSERSQNHEQIWHNLMQLPELDLLAWAEKSPDTQFGDWLQLAAIGKNARLTLDEHLAEVERWRQQNPGHPAAITMPGSLAILADIAASRPKQVALLLPLSGPLAKTGQAVRDGFMAAYFESLNKGSAIPLVNVYDTQAFNSIDSAYSAAQFEGNEWVIGPFNKKTVQTLQQRTELPLPTLALNYGERNDNSPASNLYQFGLAAEDEAVQIANQAWQDGHRRALVMMPKGNWGQRVYAAFEQRWTELGGEIGEQRYYSNRKDYNPEIKALLNVDDSQQRFNTMRKILRESTEFEPRRRQDVDWVFMVALPKQARQIKPTLEFNFAGDLPIYATSHIYSGVVNQRKDRDLNGIRFCDAPWLLEKSDLHQTVESTLENGQGGYTRLYAMGVDAFRLLPRLKQLQAFPNSQVFGSTGALSMDNSRRIHRQTQCTRFRSGKPAQLAASD